MAEVSQTNLGMGIVLEFQKTAKLGVSQVICMGVVMVGTGEGETGGKELRSQDCGFPESPEPGAFVQSRHLRAAPCLEDLGTMIQAGNSCFVP